MQRATASRSLLRATAVGCALGLALPWAALAGNGTFNGGTYNFCVSVRFNATPQELQQIRTALANGSQTFADATDGQQRFGTVTIVNDSGASQSSEYWVHPGNGRAYATLGRYGVRGEHINLFFLDNFQALHSANGDAYTVAHEHVHHAFGIADEYSGSTGAAECAPPPDSAALSYSLMDNYFTRGGNAPGIGGGYTLNELCVASNHDPDGDTFQESLNHQSAWETIAAHPKRSATAPAGLPVDAPPSPHTVSFVDGIGGLRTVLVVDRSGSMLSEDRLGFAKRGGKLFVNRLRDGDGVGVASFDCSTSVNFPLTMITGDGTRAGARAALDSLSAAGSTNIGGGLLAGLGQLSAQPVRSCNELIVLLSDGDHNCGTPPSAVIPQLQAQGVAVLTVGVGSGISTSGEATLQEIASSTGGKYYRVGSAFQLVGLYLQLVFESLTGGGLLARSPEAIAQGQTVSLPVEVEVGAPAATFALALGDVGDVVTFALESPSGQLIDEGVAAVDPNIDYFVEDNSRIFVVRSPEAGEWTEVATAGPAVSGQIELLAFADHDGVQLNLALSDETPTFPAATVVAATPRYQGLSVTGAEIAGTVLRPDGSRFQLRLFDDGDQLHGDAIAKDGIYSSSFDDYVGDGTYTFELTVQAREAKTFGGEELFPSNPGATQAVPSFTRMASVAAVVTGTPGAAAATVEYMPEPLDLASRGRYIKAFIELPGGLDPGTISLASIKVTAIDGRAIKPIGAAAGSGTIGDFDNDGVPDLLVQLDRRQLEPLLPVGSHLLRLEGRVGSTPFVSERSVGIVRLANP